MEKGFILPAPKPKKKYTKYVATHFLDRYSDRIADSFRQGAALGVLAPLDKKRNLSQIPKGLIGALMAFTDDRHSETQEAIGRMRQVEGNLDEARLPYERAAEIIRADKNLNPLVPPWSEVLAKLNARLEALRT